MKAASKQAWLGFLASRKQVHLYTVDPGAHAIGRELIQLLRQRRIPGNWFVEGWSADHAEGAMPASALLSSLRTGDTLILGSQTDYGKTQAALDEMASLGVETVFVFDHWKNFTEHFTPGCYPDAIVVPDELARELLAGALGQNVRQRVHVLPHLGIEAIADAIIARKAAVEPGTLALLLDPTELSDGLGYDWQAVLRAATARAETYPLARLLVQPHPRQDRVAVEKQIKAMGTSASRVSLFTGDTESLIGKAEEVWGMTTSALNVAIVLGKPICSFQPRRNAAGIKASNPRLEPFVIT